MKSIAFPKIFNGNRTKLVVDNAASLQNLRLLLLSKTKEFFGDPEYGTELVQELFKHNSIMLVDIIKDHLYETVLNYAPDLKLSKDDIEIVQVDNVLTANITVQALTTQEKLLMNINLLTMNTDY